MKGAIEHPEWDRRTKPADCGTNSGYMRHWNQGDEACAPCKAAHAAHRRGLYQGTVKPKTKRRNVTPFRSVPCPYCGAEAGAYCFDGKSTTRLTYKVHADRINRYEAEVA